MLSSPELLSQVLASPVLASHVLASQGLAAAGPAGRFGLASLLVSALVGLAVAVALGRPVAADRGLRSRLAQVPGGPPARCSLDQVGSATAATGGRRLTVGPLFAAVVAGFAVFLFVGGVVGALLGLVLALGLPRLLSRLEPASVVAERQRLLADLPLALDLLAGCLSGGASPGEAAHAVGRAIGGPCGTRLLAVASALAVGSTGQDAWLRLSGPDGRAGPDPLAAAARALSRAAEGGAPVAAAVARLAAEARAESRSRGQAAARRAGVLAVAPLGLCFLPAFVLIGVVPVIAGLAGPLLSSL